MILNHVLAFILKIISDLKPEKMKMKTLLFAVMALAFTATTQAQSLKIGIKGGTDINKINGKSFKESFSYGYQIGAFAEIGVNSRWGIQPEVLLSQVNADTTSNFSDVYQLNGLSDVKLKYLKIPILLSYKPNEFVALQVGPQFGVLLDKNKNPVENGKDAFKNGDFSMVGGLQLNISKIRIYGRYALGLSNLNDIDNKEKWRSQSFQVGLGLTL